MYAIDRKNGLMHSLMVTEVKLIRMYHLLNG